MKEALRRGFRVTTNTTLFDGASPKSVRAFFDEMMDLGVEGMMLSPGYSYDKAPDQKHFLGRARTRRMFRAILSNRKKSWQFNLSPLFLEFLMGKRTYPCTPWGMPTYNVFGWQKPCYLLQDGYAETFQELLDNHGLAELRDRVGQSGVRELHGPQRIRSLGCQRNLQLAGRIPGHGEGHVVHRLSRRRSPPYARRARSAGEPADPDRPDDKFIAGNPRLTKAHVGSGMSASR